MGSTAGYARLTRDHDANVCVFRGEGGGGGEAFGSCSLLLLSELLLHQQIAVRRRGAQVTDTPVPSAAAGPFSHALRGLLIPGAKGPAALPTC